MTCNCGNGDTPEYYITLDGVGVDGYSPKVNITNDNTASFKIEVVNKSNTQETPAIPKLGYIQNTYVSNTSLASTLSAYSTTAQMNTALDNKLNKDGSNADSYIIINGNRIWNDGILTPHLYVGSIGSGLQLSGNSIVPYNSGNDTVMLRNYQSSTLQKDAYIEVDGNGNINLGTTNPYKAYYNSKEIATVDQIPTVGNGTITLTQNGVTKGTFTTNQSGNTTIELDAGGGELTNPLVISNEAGTRNLTLGINESNNKVIAAYSIVSGGGGWSFPIYLLGSASNPLALTEGETGLYTLSLNVDNDTIKVNQDGQLYADVQGGSSYTEGTGIDITNDTISVDESVVMTTGNQSTINFGAKQFSTVTVGNSFNTGVGGLIGKKNASGALFLAQVSTSDDIIFGDNTAPLYLMGSNDRPKYTGGNTVAENLALSSDISNMLTTNTSQTISTGTKTMASGTSQVFVNGSSLDIRGNNTLFLRGASQAQGGYLGLSSRSRDTVNDVAINVIRLQANTTGDLANLRLQGYDLYNNPYLYNGFTRLGQVSISSGDINITTESGVELQYNGNEIATVNNIPDVSQLQEKLTAGTGIDINNEEISVDSDYIEAHKAYLADGDLLTDPQGLQDVTYYNYSSFDRSKFAIVGSPNITDDGIASRFSNGNYLTGSFTATTPKKEYIVKLKIKLNSIPTSTNRLWTLKNSVNCFIALYNNAISCRLDGNTNLITVNKNTDINWDINQDIYITMKVTASKAYLTVECNGNSITKEANTNFGFIRINAFDLGGQYAYFTTGSIDLKQFSITVDGKEVFNGNKEGLDVIKPDNYTVVGSPTITDDGIASGFSGSNYLSFPLNLNIRNTININIEGTHYGTQTNPGELFYISDGTNRLDLYRNKFNKMGGQIGTSGSDYQYLRDSSVTTSNASYKWIVMIDIVNNTVSYVYYENNILVFTSNAQTLTNLANINWSNVTVGRIGGQYSTLFGSIDLNAFKIYVDGQLVYQPCLKIPYTLSKTGSKVVGSQYYSRVQDTYNYQGYAPYYTLDEANGNFTLPMGEIYGYITRLEGIVKDLQTRLAALESNINGGGARVVQQGLLGMSPLSLGRPQLLSEFNPEDELDTMNTEPIEDDIQEEELEPQETEEEPIEETVEEQEEPQEEGGQDE